MKVEKKEVTVKELVDGFEDKGLDGAWAYGGKLNVRPNYQRAFRYDDEHAAAVINSVMNDLPLNSMYWHVLDDGKFNLIDGQQRTCSLGEFALGNIAFSDGRFFINFHDDEQAKFLNYPLHIYTCEGTDSERLAWFKTINFSGAPLSPQELRNATFPGPWLQDAKKWFSVSGATGHQIAGNLIGKSVEDQSFLEIALKWVSADNIEDYMATHQKDKDASDLWADFQTIVNWVFSTFPDYHSQMKGLDWGKLHQDYHKRKYNGSTNSARVTELMDDPDVTSKRGIFEYILSGETNENLLSIRQFDIRDKAKKTKEQGGRCAFHKQATCTDPNMEKGSHADHIEPWSKGGKTELENCQVLCAGCNARKGANF